VVVPTSAVQSEGGRRLVFVPGADGLSFQPREVALGMTHEEWTEVVRGLAAGEQVVASGARVLKSELVRGRSASP
jgi:Cu(I)/Ag(I) efflux system membrane fusion protein